MSCLQPLDVYNLYKCTSLVNALRGDFGAFEIKRKESPTRIEQIRWILEVNSFDESAAKFGIIRAQLERKGQVINARDLQIASIAIANDLCVITHNVKEFNRVEKLRVEDWAGV